MGHEKYTKMQEYLELKALDDTLQTPMDLLEHSSMIPLVKNITLLREKFNTIESNLKFEVAKFFGDMSEEEFVNWYRSFKERRDRGSS